MSSKQHTPKSPAAAEYRQTMAHESSDLLAKRRRDIERSADDTIALRDSVVTENFGTLGDVLKSSLKK